MKSLYLFIFAMFALNTQAAETRESASSLLNRIVTEKPAALNADKYEDYSAEKDGSYKGRVDNRAKERLNARTGSSAGMSRNIVLSSSKNIAQLENLEATAGELVQKLEDDRQKKLKNHSNRYDDNANILKSTYTTVSQIKAENLGSEQDPAIQNAFKCYDLESCNKNPEIAKGDSDRRALPECKSDERLHWNATNWECLGIFEDPKPFTGCSDDQYQKSLSGGNACVDYIYFWKLEGFTDCQPDGKQSAPTNCYRKKEVADTNHVKVSNSKCLGSKPLNQEKSCKYISYKSYSLSCPSGYSLSGTQCAKRIKGCRYDNYNMVYYEFRANCGNGDGQSTTGTWDGKVISSYTKGREMWYNGSECRGGRGSYDYKKWEICVDFMDYKNAIKNCPTGYTFNSSLDKCQK